MFETYSLIFATKSYRSSYEIFSSDMRKKSSRGGEKYFVMKSKEVEIVKEVKRSDSL